MTRGKAICLGLAMIGALLLTAPVWGAQGDLIWETPLTFLPDYDTINLNYTSVSPTTYILTGLARNANGSGVPMGFIKAYDVATGILKWDKTLTLGANSNGYGGFVVDGSLVIVRGSYASGSPTTVMKHLLQAFNADTGQLVWEVARNFETIYTQNPTSPPPLSTANNRVFAAYISLNADGSQNLSTYYVRAFQVRNVVLPNALLLNE